MQFEHQIIDQETPGTENDVCLIADVNGDGCNDLIIAGKQGSGNVVWYEYPNWERHTIGTAQTEAGGCTIDLTGNGLPDLVVGNPGELNEGRELYWFENPGDSSREWTRRVICSDLAKYHDQEIGDVDNDGAPELIVPSQHARVLAYYDIPENPRQTPWPLEHRHIICDDIEVEGIQVVDLDGDGLNELVAGPNWFKKAGDRWERQVIAADFALTRVAAGDLTGDGKPDVVLAEGESYPGRLAWFSGFPEWRMHLLADNLHNPHSLALADFSGNGLLDIFVAEMGLNRCESPRAIIYENQGDGEFVPHVISRGIALHDAKVGIIGKSSNPSIVGKPYNPGRSVHLWLNQGA